MAKTIKEQYMQERRRIQNFIRRAEKRGYIVPKDLLPKIPKRVTKASISRLQKLDAKAIYDKSTYVSRETGEVVSGRKGRAIERTIAAKKGAETRKRKAAAVKASQSEPPFIPRETDIILENLREQLETFMPSISATRYQQEQQVNHRDLLLGALDDAIDELGEDAVAQNIKKHSNELSDLIETALYTAYDNVMKTSLVQFYNILHGDAMSTETNIELSTLEEELDLSEIW